jgi:MFS superfamily sulfate permease-like transporter
MTFRLPLLDWVSDYRREWLGSDLVGGLTTAAVVIPNALAHATVAGLPIQMGLYTAFVPLTIYAVLGTSRPLSVTTSATVAILTGGELGRVAPNGDTSALLHATALLTLMVGAMLIVASVLRLGRLFFLNAERIAEKIRSLMAEANPRAVLLDVCTVVRRSPLGEALGHECLFFYLELAVDKYGAQHGTSVAVDTTGSRTA